MKEAIVKVENWYSCQVCQDLVYSEDEINIIKGKYPLCFKCKNKIKVKKSYIEIWFQDNLIVLDTEGFNLLQSFVNDKYELFIENGYLARKKDGKIQFFHRLLLDDELQILGREKEVHHINENKLDNRRDNLQILSKDSHQGLHDKKKFHRAYRTWASKVYGEYDFEDHTQEFENWIAEKEMKGW